MPKICNLFVIIWKRKWKILWFLLGQRSFKVPMTILSSGSFFIDVVCLFCLFCFLFTFAVVQFIVTSAICLSRLCFQQCPTINRLMYAIVLKRTHSNIRTGICFMIDNWTAINLMYKWQKIDIFAGDIHIHLYNTIIYVYMYIHKRLEILELIYIIKKKESIKEPQKLNLCLCNIHVCVILLTYH